MTKFQSSPPTLEVNFSLQPICKQFLFALTNLFQVPYNDYANL